MFERLNDFIDKIYFFKNNPLKLRVVRRWLCKHGGHDYEFVKMDGETGVLECYYCGQNKGSTPAKTLQDA